MTKGRIEDLLPEKSINSDTAMVILNAVFFKGTWKNKFTPDTSEKGREFRSSTGKVSHVPMMTLKANMAYKSDFGATAVELPYSDGKYSMVMVLPDEKKTVEGFIQSLDVTKLQKFIGNYYAVRVGLTMPKFKIEKSYELKQVLEGLGARKMFESIDMSGMVDASAPLAVSEVVHKALVEVNEEGTEAAAATGVIFQERVAHSTRKITFDRPFLFILKHIETNAVLFMGVVRQL